MKQLMFATTPRYLCTWNIEAWWIWTSYLFRLPATSTRGCDIFAMVDRFLNEEGQTWAQCPMGASVVMGHQPCCGHGKVSQLMWNKWIHTWSSFIVSFIMRTFLHKGWIPRKAGQAMQKIHFVLTTAELVFHFNKIPKERTNALFVHFQLLLHFFAINNMLSLYSKIGYFGYYVIPSRQFTGRENWMRLLSSRKRVKFISLSVELLRYVSRSCKNSEYEQSFRNKDTFP